MRGSHHGLFPPCALWAAIWLQRRIVAAVHTAARVPALTGCDRVPLPNVRTAAAPVQSLAGGLKSAEATRPRTVRAASWTAAAIRASSGNTSRKPHSFGPGVPLSAVPSSFPGKASVARARGPPRAPVSGRTLAPFQSRAKAHMRTGRRLSPRPSGEAAAALLTFCPATVRMLKAAEAMDGGPCYPYGIPGHQRYYLQRRPLPRTLEDGVAFLPSGAAGVGSDPASPARRRGALPVRHGGGGISSTSS